MRPRSLDRYVDQILTTFPNVEKFLAKPSTEGVISVMYKKAPLDFYVEDRGAKTTLVAFHSALTEKHKTLPVFAARDTAAGAGMNLISVADPSVALGVDLAWYLGNRDQGPIRPTISKIVTRILGALKSERTILFGASGGGYAAAYYAPNFPGSVALVMNPRMNLAARPAAAVGEYIQVCHHAPSVTPARRIRGEYVPNKVVDTYGQRIDHHVAVLQNTGDSTFKTHQADPFLEELADSGKVFVRYGDWGIGHVPVPKTVIAETLKHLGDTSVNIPAALAAASFSPPGKAMEMQPPASITRLPSLTL